MSGPFGGNVAGSRTLKYGPDAMAQRNLADDSSDDEAQARPPGPHIGLTTPLTVHVQPPQEAGGAMNLGRAGRKEIADITPVEVSSDIGLSSVGGLDDHIDKLKEMVLLPLLYPELYAKWKVPPPRGVLFHGPPGTGKTLLARALASSVSTGNRKVTFYMRKGSDVMSKWQGEAERQLRLLFEEAKKNQPSIIFFDEFDGLAPVRSSKQEQVHASIVTTLLALMDGMDNRGEIVVIGATNRPDSIDPAFRRAGRFDREFYFPLPNQAARRAIIDIHTRGWDPPLEAKVKDDLAALAKGYGGSDLRALCTEAVINAVQRTYPQIYRSEKKLVIDTNKIKVIPKDFMLAMRKILPSSERQTGPISEPLPKKVEPLLRHPFEEIVKRLEDIIPQKKKHLTALEEAEFDDPDNAAGFEFDELQRIFERGRVFRPRLLIKGMRGMGQKYLASAILNKLDNFFVRTLDLGTLYGDAGNPPEAILSNAFREARSHQPSVLFIPHINSWYNTVGPHILGTLSSFLRSLAANDAVLLLGIMECDSHDEEPDPKMMKDLFGFSSKHDYQIRKPDKVCRWHYFNIF
jgi:SpoVK/Ycf46/Vps4 family AAA+-type ATPase